MTPAMRALFVFVTVAISVAAQNPSVQLINTTRPASAGFVAGDHFEVVITGTADRPVSIKTVRNSMLRDWSPVVGWTDPSGRWSTTGRFEKSDCGPWIEAWTVGDKLASPAVSFSVGGPCVTPSPTEGFRTRDGRTLPSGVVPANETAEGFGMWVIETEIEGIPNSTVSGQSGDNVATLVTKLIGANALNDGEAANVLSMIRAAFSRPDRIPLVARYPVESVRLLRHLDAGAGQESLKQEIARTVAFVLAQ